MKYEYMVVYFVSNGMGRCQVTRNKKIKSYQDIENLNKSIDKYQNREVLVTNYKLIRKIITYPSFQNIQNVLTKRRKPNGT